MIDLAIAFVIGILVGTFIGMCLAALIVADKNNWEE